MLAASSLSPSSWPARCLVCGVKAWSKLPLNAHLPSGSPSRVARKRFPLTPNWTLLPQDTPSRHRRGNSPGAARQRVSRVGRSLLPLTPVMGPERGDSLAGVLAVPGAQREAPTRRHRAEREAQWWGC